MSNRLKNETSPYLLQHSENPVDWFPWGAEAFRRAKEEDKPIFLSIGYSTCHWCHVMAHETFENSEIARLLNRNFISVKVDREERPDIDSIYMSVCQAFSGSGGWPTSIFMTAEQRPFFAGTYFPPTTQGGMIGFDKILELISDKWNTDREALLDRADQIVRSLERPGARTAAAKESLPTAAAEIFKQIYDSKNGGFGSAPKFPAAHNITFLLSFYEHYRDTRCLKISEHSLVQMYRGGLFDHIGGGFCRYSTDSRFLVPHFEKMLYDNALLISAYCRAFTVTKKPLYLKIAERTAEYVLREMTSPDGAFYSAQDADSDGEEGKYYIFTPEEITSLLGREKGKEFNRRFDITPGGNFEGQSVPNLLGSDPCDESFDAFFEQIDRYRKSRCSLHLDDKILTSWNGLMIAALCRLYRAGGNERYLTAAKAADRFICKNLLKDGELFVSFRAARLGAPGFLDDYAAYIYAQLELYGATLDGAYLEQAEKLCQKICASFADPSGGFYLYGKESEKLILRPKETYDGALPSGNSLMAWNLVRLSQLFPGEEYDELSQRQLGFMASESAHYPPGYAMFLSALLEQLAPPPKMTVVLSPDEDGDKLKADLTRGSFSEYLTVFLPKPTRAFPLKNGRTTFYVCRNKSCLPPVNDPGELKS